MEEPEAWWSEHGEGELGYSSLLEQLAPTAAARQGLLASYFEPTSEDRERGTKLPSKAHLAIAQLVKQGHVKVIVTTNFDRLMEQALESVGVAPQVISRPEAVNGMAPLTHASATVIKLHGDYKDLGSKNTPTELESYPEQWNALLHQVFSDYGLIISGWSAEWDTALVTALEAASRRYPLYWDSRSSRGESASRLLVNRDGRVLQFEGADELFTDLAASIEALQGLSESPLTTAMAISRLKRSLLDPTRRIELYDLVMGAADRVADAIRAEPLSAGQEVNEAFMESLYERHLASAGSLLPLLITGLWHDTDGTHDQLWLDVLQRLVDAGTTPVNSATQVVAAARLIPAHLALATMGVAAAARGRESLFIRAATTIEGRTQMGHGEAVPSAQLLHANHVFASGLIKVMPRWGDTRWVYPISHLLLTDLRVFFADFIRLDADFVAAFHGYEYRIGLIQSQLAIDGYGYSPADGEYVGERGWSFASDRKPLAEITFVREASRRADWPWPEYLGGPDGLEKVLEAHRELLRSYSRSR
ncbi:SIR2 family protein [Herbiconiux daphne]|uniref:SIR2 family protein n=1 Tax=Herbiconiux daphne TaxID=2970914 RepID=A0ABT2H577_9MICO|nr:SIR2 family protein [Herbiconiux daphne]MCS5735092.1 SIR2 family protein [Herbiconiux daphne]